MERLGGGLNGRPAGYWPARPRRDGSVRLLAQLAFAQVVGPAKSHVDDRSVRMVALGLAYAASDDAALRRLVVHRAERQPERVGDEAGQRRLHERGDLPHLGDRDGGETVVVEDALEQPDRLLADRSGRDEQDEVDLV